jgi:hypothetical protein
MTNIKIICKNVLLALVFRSEDQKIVPNDLTVSV